MTFRNLDGTSESCWSPHNGTRWWSVKTANGWEVRISLKDGSVIWEQTLNDASYELFLKIATDRSEAEKRGFPIEKLERDDNMSVAQEIQSMTEPLGPVADIFLKIPNWYDEDGFESQSSF